MTAALFNALVGTDRQYFTSGATNDHIEGATVSWVPGLSHLPAGCVVHDVTAPDPRRCARWLAEVERAAADRGATMLRIYPGSAEDALATSLRDAGLVARTERAYVTSLPTCPGRARTSQTHVELRALDPADDAAWTAVDHVHHVGGIGSGIHTAPADEWTELMRRRCSSDDMDGRLVVADGVACGSVATLTLDGLRRSKNILIGHDHRRRSIARTVLALLASSASAEGCVALGAFAVDRTAGSALYPAAGMSIIGAQTEWSRPISRVSSKDPT